MSKYENADELEECPKCQSTFGYYSQLYAFGWLQDNTLFTGEKENTGMHDSLTYSRESKYVYCIECNKRIGLNK